MPDGGCSWDEEEKKFHIWIDNCPEKGGKLLYNYTIKFTAEEFAELIFVAGSAVARGVGEGLRTSLQSESKSLAMLLAFASGAVDGKGQLIVKRR